jgi:hypothetical protein
MKEDATTVLLRALRARLAGAGKLCFEEIVSRSWASVTFLGARHEIVFTLEGDAAEATADAFIAALAADEYELRGHILADIALVSKQVDSGLVRIALEALTVEDS